MRFAVLTEQNEHEGETWVWYLQVKGNKKRLRKLKKIIDKHEAQGYTLQLDPLLSERDVDVVIANQPADDEGYYPAYNKVVGKIGPIQRSALVKWDGVITGLYKGEIQSLFE